MATQEIVLKFRGDPSLLKGALNELKTQHGTAMAEITRQQKAEAAAAVSLQRQRSSALITVWKADTRAAVAEERVRTRAILAEEKQLAAQMIRESRASQAVRSQSIKTAEQEERRLAATMIREARAAQNVRTQAERQAFAEITRLERQRRQIMAENARAVAAIAKSEADARIREGRRAANAVLGTLKGGSGGSDIAAAFGFGTGAAVGFTIVNELRAGAAAWINYASKLESTKIAFTTMLGSAQRATDHLKELQAFAIKTPFQFEELIDASQRMQALGFEAEQVIPVLTDVGNAVAAAGGGAERLDRVVLALSQMQSKGRVATQEMNQLAEAGIPGWRILEQQLGKSRAELVKMVEQGEVSAKVFLDAFQKFSQQNFGGLMEKQAKTFTGAMSNIKDAALLMTTTALAPLFEQMTKVTLELGRMGTGFVEAAQGAAQLIAAIQGIGGAVTGLGSIPLPEILKNLPLIQGLRSAGGLLGLAGTPEIGPITGTGQPATPLRSSEEFAETEEANALRTRSEEAKRIATDRIAQQEQLFKLGKITREQETENIIAQLKIRALAEKQALDEEIIRKQKELLANRDNADKVKTIIEQVGALNQQIKNNQSAVDREIANKRAELQAQERRNLLEHQQSRLAILLKTGEVEISAVEAEVQAGIKSREEGIAKIEQIENAGFDARARLLKLELAQSSVEPAERQKINDKIAALGIERTANEQKQAERRREIVKQAHVNELALEQQLARIRQTQRQGELERIDYLLGRQAIMESTAIARRIAIEREAHEEAMLLIEIELKQLTTSAERKIELDNKKIESEQRYTDAHKILTQQRIDALNAEHAASAGQRVPGTSDDGIAQQAGAIVNAQLGPPPELQAHIDMVGTLRTAYLDLASGIAQGVGQMVHDFVLLGNAGPQAFKKVLASALAAVSAQAAVQAIYELALGFAALTPWGAAIYGPAVLHFKAAALLGSIALIAGAAGRVTAGGAFQSTTTGGGGGRGSGSSSTVNPVQPKPIDADRRTSGSQSADVVAAIKEGLAGLALRAKTETQPGVIVDIWIEEYKGGGRLRNVVKSDGGDT